MTLWVTLEPGWNAFQYLNSGLSTCSWTRTVSASVRIVMHPSCRSRLGRIGERRQDRVVVRGLARRNDGHGRHRVRHRPGGEQVVRPVVDADATPVAPRGDPL